MVATHIKICGINSAAALDAAVRARADFAGFVFYPPSPRHLALNAAAELGSRAAGRIARIGLFVDADDGAVGEAISAAGLDGLQLHGMETPARCAQVRARFGLPVWKAIAVAAPADIRRAADYAGAIDRVLFDAKTPKGALPGGMGLAFDWSLLSNLRLAMPWALAGGLGPDNVADAIRTTGAPLVDTSSGVESAPGVKDEGRIAAFCAAVRSV